MKEDLYVIQVNNLNKKYKKGNKHENEVFKNFNIKFEKGNVHCLLGASGCGKSSLLRIIARIEEFESGEIIFDNEIKKDNNISLSMVLQENNLLPWLTVTQNIKFALDATKKKVSLNQFDEILKKHELYEVKDYYPYELSVGLKQKVALAKSIITNPKIILLDEPFCALDFISKENIHKIFLNEFAKENFTSILSTHYVEEAVKLGDYIHLLSKKNKYERIKNPLKKPREKDNEYNKFIKYIKEKYKVQEEKNVFT